MNLQTHDTETLIPDLIYKRFSLISLLIEDNTPTKNVDGLNRVPSWQWVKQWGVKTIAQNAKRSIEQMHWKMACTVNATEIVFAYKSKSNLQVKVNITAQIQSLIMNQSYSLNIMKKQKKVRK